MTLRETRGDAEELVDILAYTLAEVKAETLPPLACQLVSTSAFPLLRVSPSVSA